MAEPDQADLGGTILALEVALARRDFASLPGGLASVARRAIPRDRRERAAMDPRGDDRGAPCRVADVRRLDRGLRGRRGARPGVVIARFASVAPGRAAASLRSSVWVRAAATRGGSGFTKGRLPRSVGPPEHPATHSQIPPAEAVSRCGAVVVPARHRPWRGRSGRFPGRGRTRRRRIQGTRSRSHRSRRPFVYRPRPSRSRR